MFLLQTHYEILGVSTSATDEQIKAAFRRLAKLYHPDKNPNGKDQFEKILTAYEILIDSTSRYKYDQRLKGFASSDAVKKKTQSSGQKNWSFNEEELKRRQYYQEYYKKEYEKYAKAKVDAKSGSTYNEYKYVLFAAPLAVALLLFIINAFNSSDETSSSSENEKVRYQEIKMSADPYTSFFKLPIYDTVVSRVLEIKNTSDLDFILNIYTTKNKFVRSCVIKSGYVVQIEQLPNILTHINLTAGTQWNGGKEYKTSDVIGGFEDSKGFYSLDLSKTNGWSFSLSDTILKTIPKLTEAEFFKRD